MKYNLTVIMQNMYSSFSVTLTSSSFNPAPLNTCEARNKLP